MCYMIGRVTFPERYIDIVLFKYVLKILGFHLVLSPPEMIYF